MRIQFTNDNKTYTLETAAKAIQKYEVVEVCPKCGAENIMTWDVEKDGYVAYCPHCGSKMMLCDECLHSDNAPICDWNPRNGCCREHEKCKKKGVIMRKEFQYCFQITKFVLFEVAYCTPLDNKSPDFTTSAEEFSKNKRGHKCGGQAQDKILPENSIARQFWKKWDKKHLKDLSDDEYREVVKDIEELKEKYNFIEDIRDTFKGDYDKTGFPLRERILLSKMNLKK